MSGRIFINYRRSDDRATAGRLFDRLRKTFRRDQLFFDVDDIRPGLDFVKVLEEQISRCDIVLAVMGHNWINASDEAGVRRLENPEDFVRIEIESAFTQGKLVIPVLIDEARMPREKELPDSIKPLVRHQSARLRHERFHADMRGLIKTLRQALSSADALPAQPEVIPRADKKERPRRAKQAARE
jgi:TIR domain